MTKTSVRRAGQRQRLAGVVVNERANVERRQYDLLKATLYNAARHGPAGQNRSLATFAQIDWDSADR